MYTLRLAVAISAIGFAVALTTAVEATDTIGFTGAPVEVSAR